MLEVLDLLVFPRLLLSLKGRSEVAGSEVGWKGTLVFVSFDVLCFGFA